MLPHIHYEMHDTLSKTSGDGRGGGWGGGEGHHSSLLDE